MTRHLVKPESCTSFLSKLAMAELIKRAEDYALGQVFTSYPVDMHWESIITLCLDDKLREEYNDGQEKLENYDNCLELCSEFEDMWWENVPAILEEKKKSIIHHFKDLTEDN